MIRVIQFSGKRALRWGGLMVLIFSALFANLQAADAAGGYGISQTGTTGQALGVDPAGTKVCTVWTQFDVGSPQVFFRLYDIATQAWTPPLNADPEVASDGGSTSKMRCTVDSNGNAHVVWQDGGSTVKHRSRAANGTWSAIASFGGSQPDVDADSSGKVWLVDRVWGGDNNPSSIELRSWTQATGWSGPKSYNTGGDADTPRIGVDNLGNVHVLFGNGPSHGGISYVALQSNNTFGSQLSVPNGGSGAVQADIAVDRDDGTVHVVYAKDWTHVYYARKGLNESNFGLFKEAANGSDAVDNPTIAWATGGQLFVAFNNQKGSYVAGVTSTDNGQNWTQIVPVTNPGGHVANPMAVADVNGGSYAVYNNSNDGAKVYFASTSGFVPVAERCAGFGDVRNSTPACPAITNLTGSGVISGYATNPPTFGPADTVQRAQVAAFLVRGLGWGGMSTGPKSFTDFGQLTGELRNDSLILANACTPSGSNNCVAQGYGDGRFGPNDGVTYAQVMSFVARAFVYDGPSKWQPQPGGPQYYSNVPAVHDTDVRTYNFYAGQITAVPMPSTPEGWNAPAPRAWVAVVIYQALQNK